MQLHVQAAAVAAEGAARAQHAVAGNDDGDGIGRHRRADGAAGTRVADTIGQLLVTHDVTERDLRVQQLEHVTAETVRQPPVDVHVERLPASFEVLVELAAHGIESLRMFDDPRRDVVGQVLEEDIFGLVGERDPDETLGRRCQQHRADGRVDRAPRDLDEPFTIGAATEAGKSLFERALAALRSRSQLCLDLAHRSSSRSRCTPARTFCRAAASEHSNAAAMSAVRPVGDETQQHRAPLLRWQLADAAPQPVVVEDVGELVRATPAAAAIRPGDRADGHRATIARPGGIDHLAMSDGEQPAADVVGVLEGRIGT